MNETETNQPMNKRQIFLLFMRYIAVAIVTVLLLAFMFEMSHLDDFGPGFMLLAAAIIFFYITIPFIVIGFWIYSFIKSIGRRTKADKILLCFHFADLLIFNDSVNFEVVQSCLSGQQSQPMVYFLNYFEMRRFSVSRNNS